MSGSNAPHATTRRGVTISAVLRLHARALPARSRTLSLINNDLSTALAADSPVPNIF